MFFRRTLDICSTDTFWVYFLEPKNALNKPDAAQLSGCAPASALTFDLRVPGCVAEAGGSKEEMRGGRGVWVTDYSVGETQPPPLSGFSRTGMSKRPTWEIAPWRSIFVTSSRGQSLPVCDARGALGGSPCFGFLRNPRSALRHQSRFAKSSPLGTQRTSTTIQLSLGTQHVFLILDTSKRMISKEIFESDRLKSH